MKISFKLMSWDLFVCKYPLYSSYFKFKFLNLNRFLLRTNVDMEKQLMTVLSPQPRPLSRTRLLLSEIQFVDSH
jgi:hypothetical protein